MTLQQGARLGPYEITAAIGAGGMGEVYRARDVRLDRTVAIKILPDLFAADPERIARFEREAKTLAALNHPHIAQIYGVIEVPREGGGTPLSALVMEFVEGEDLAQRLQRGALPSEDAIDIGRQIAEALEAAHEQGIVHRDLKPANVKVRADGTVKVLDFGLAKALTPDIVPSDQMNSPTFTSPALPHGATQAGFVLGTAAYMAPEQAKGKMVDRRADIWAFGLVLHEMLTGKKMWVGETAAETLAYVITREPDLSALPPATPPRLRTLIARCLVKDPKARLRDVGEARIALTEMAGGSSDHPVSTAAAATPARRRAAWLPWTVAAAMTLVALALGLRSLSTTQQDPPAPLRAALPPPKGAWFDGSLALSPDGTRLAFSSIGENEVRSMLWVQDLATGNATVLRHTDGAVAPFWSPDGREIAFFTDAQLKRIPVEGGAAQVVATTPNARGGAWAPNGRIIYAPDFRSGLHSVDAAGGTSTPITTPAGAETSHRWPVLLPGGRHLLFLSQTSEGGTADDASAIEIVELDGSNRRTVTKQNSSPLYAEPGFLLYWRGGGLHAQKFDVKSGTVSGSAMLVADNVAYNQNEAVLASAAGRRLVYLGADAPADSGLVTLSWLDRAGKVLSAAAPPSDGSCGVTLAPSGRLLVFGKAPPMSNGCDLWMRDLDRNVETRLTFGSRNEYLPVFSADGRSLLFGTDTGSERIMRLETGRSGEGETLFEKVDGFMALDPGALLRDGRSLIVGAIRAGTKQDIIRYDLVDKKVYPIVTTPFMDISPTVSPDGKWLAYCSDRSGRMEVYVEPIGGGAAWAVSSSGGIQPQWRDDGKELFYLSAADPMTTGPSDGVRSFSRSAVDRLMAVDVLPGAGFRTSTPKQLFRASFQVDAGFAVAPGGQRFIFGLVQRGATRPLTILSDWQPR